LLVAPAQDVAMADVEAAMDSGYGIYAGGQQRWAVLQFDRHAAQWASCEEWHPLQQGCWLEDGRFELRLPYVDDTELLMDVLRQGDQVKVLAPPELAQRVHHRLQSAAARYDEAG
jgi:predicted DNA-binding transcriptional regulator YafY